MFADDKNYLLSAKALLDEFASGTGLVGENGIGSEIFTDLIE
jgi:hypothetical protein